MARSTSRADRVIAFIEKYCRVPEGTKVGQPIKLAPFQKKFIREVYRPNVRRGILSIARKNGKTALIACLLLAHIIGPEAVRNSQIVSGARSRDQASLVFALACKMLQANSELDGLYRIVPSSKRIVGLHMNVEFRALAADGQTAHGLSPILAILDEAGQVKGPQDDFIDAITTAQGAYESPLLLTISTQAPTDNDLLSRWIDDAKDDPATVCHVYSAPADAELTDKKAHKAANPALGLFRSRADVEDQAAQAVRSPTRENAFRNLTLNQRVQMHSPAVSVKVWKANSGPVDVGVFARNPVYAGLDLSATTDLTALVLAAREDGIIHVAPYFWTPESTLTERSRKDRVPYDLWVKQGDMIATPGPTIKYSQVASDMVAILDGMDLVNLRFDRYRMDLLKAALDQIGVELPTEEFGQGYVSMTPAWQATEEALLTGSIRHGNHPVLNMCALNAVLHVDPAGNKKLDKAKSNGRIDGMVALLMAVSGLETAESAGASVGDWLDALAS